MKIDNSRIEEIAVDTVNAYISERTRRVSGKLEKADTGISVDGELIFYLEAERKISTFGGTIPVQVKGKRVNSISEVTSVFRKFDIETYRNFLKLDGVLVFLVEEVFDKGLILEKQIFFKYLDVIGLVEIINELSQSGNTYKSLSFNKLDTEIDFDQVVDEIHITRRSMPASLAVYKAFNENQFQSKDAILQNFEEVVEEVTKEIRESDFYDDDSEFLKQAIPQIEQYISKDFIFDFESAIVLSSSFIKDDRYKLLQKSTFNKVLIFLAKLDNYRKEFEAAKKKLEKISELDDRYQVYYDREVFISMATSLNETDAKREVDKISWENDYQKELYILFYEIETQSISIDKLEAYEINYKYNQDFLYLLGIGFSNNSLFLRASEMFNQVMGNKNVKVLEIINYFRGSANDVLMTKNPEKINQLQIYYNELDQYLNSLKKRRLSLLQGEDMLNLISSIIKPEEFIDNEFGLTDEQDVAIIQSLLMVGDYQKIIKYLRGKEKQTDCTLLYFLFVALAEEKEYILILTEINNIIETLNTISEKMRTLLSDFFIEALIQLGDPSKFDSVDDLTKKYYIFSEVHYLRIYIFKTENNCQLTEEELTHVNQISLTIKNEEEVGVLCNFIYKYDNVDFAKKLWINLRETFSEMVSEVICTKLLQNGDEDNLLYILEIIKWNEQRETINEKLFMIELQVYSLLEQYRAIINRVRKEKNLNEQVLSLQLAAKIKLNDNAEIESLIERGSFSQNIDFRLNAGYGMIAFGFDPIRGSKILLRELIETNFQNKEVGKNYVLQKLDSLKDYDDERDLSKISGSRHYYYKLIDGKKKLEILTLPLDWDFENLDKYKIIRNNSKEYRLLLLKNEEANVIIGKRTYRIVQKIPLSRFVYNKMLPLCMGDNNSNSPIKSFTIDNGDLSEIVTFMERDSEAKSEMLKLMEKYSYTGCVQYLCNEDELFNFIYTFYNDNNFVFNLGQIIPQDINKKMQLSISSLIFLQKYELGDILPYFTELYIDLDISKRLSDILNKEAEQGYDVKKLSVIEGRPVIIERSEEQFQQHLDYLDEILELVSKVTNCNEAGFIHPDFKRYFGYDANSIQSAYDASNLFIVEDSFIQDRCNGVSVLGMAHEYFINISPNIDRYIDFLLELQEDNNIYFCPFANKLEIAKDVIESDDANVYKKYCEWILKQINIGTTTLNERKVGASLWKS
ncbi:hypothetical protein JZO73_04770 [Enterococcus plantarum]|uniref:hypothetical protein n=1 Tax=Enterococcus plantarum TaxID=1077675 RepID=UPI001A8C0A83|nr:hypothetical protein [Enterococcus plantarum]MBO0466843.1 hypothetical protein [Enterococcus plantarum]